MLLIVLLLGQLLLLSAQARERGSELEEVLLETLGPASRQGSSSAETLQELFRTWRGEQDLGRENQALRLELDATRRELIRLRGVEEELAALSRAAGYSRPQKNGLFVADVVYDDRSSWLRTLVIYSGASELRRDQPVLTEHALVGRIIVAAGHYAKVQLLTDRSSAVGAMIARTRRKGIVRGNGEETLVLDYIPLQAEALPEDLIVTSGTDGVFPRGIPIGQISQVNSESGLFHQIVVLPTADFGLLDQVYVLTQETLPPEILEALGHEAP